LTLFCGPTGAGKSTTMNTVIDSLLNSGELGVTITIEDPVEYLHHKDMTRLFNNLSFTNEQAYEYDIRCGICDTCSGT
jgi:Tfp pilus assembly pilus retraction ATPase PilT